MPDDPPTTAALPDTRDDGCPRHGEVTHHQPGCPNIPSLDGLTTTAAPIWQSCALCAEIHADWPGFSADGLRRLHSQHGHAVTGTTARRRRSLKRPRHRLRGPSAARATVGDLGP